VTPNHELIEHWITNHLAGGKDASRAERWREGAGSLRELRIVGDSRRSTKRAKRAAAPYSRFELIRKAGVAWVRLKDVNLIRESLVEELGDELGVLLEAGLSRIILDFSAVDKVSYHLAAVLSRVAGACRTCPGGMLALCGPCPGLPELVRMAGLGSLLKYHESPSDALASSSSESLRPARLPLPVLASLFNRPDRGGDQASLETMEVDLDPLLTTADLDDASRAADGPASGNLVLIETETGRMIPLLPQGVTIGREAGCHLELHDAGVSRLHAKCWVKENEAFVQDLESRNGTYLRGHRIDANPARILEGDSIRFGTVEVSVARLEDRRFQVAVESAVAGWLTERESDIDTESELPIDTGRDADADLPPAERVEFEELPDFLLCERMGDVLVITPRWDGLVDAGLCDAVREALSRAEAAGLPRRVVVSLSFVGQFSGQLVGVLLSQHLRLRPFGGEVRICEPQPLVNAYLSEIGVDQLLTLYPTLQDAVLDAWTE
jgi:pSer/pThr/pTyr-binding forkhead associated (FHA) protein/anti-anti-sigma regulatory factor